MKIEVGKYYRTRDGRKVKCLGHDRDYFPLYPYSFDDCLWRTSGGVYGVDGDEPSQDIIEEWADTPEVGTLREIGAQVGDVVSYAGIDEYEILKGKRLKCLKYNNDCGEYRYWDTCNQFRIVSRASDAKPTGPVITETVTRIVPGVYGKVRINAAFPDQGVVYLGIVPCDEEQGRCYGLNREDLIAARDILSQLIDAMHVE